MTYRILYTQEAARRIGKLDKAVKERVGKAIKKLSEQPWPRSQSSARRSKR